VLAKLPEQLALDASDQRMFALALAASLAREGAADGAVRIYEQLLSAPDASPRDAAEVRQKCAQVLRTAGRWEDARAQYAALGADARQPAHVRGVAALAAAQTWQQQNRLAEAAAAYRAASSATNLIPHFRLEAEECARACENRLVGKPARDPEANRQRLAPLPSPAAVFFVSPKGDDGNPGTLRKPFATLERAREAVRAQKVRGSLPPGGVTVFLRGGRYAVTNTFALGDADSGSVGAPVVYRAWQDEKPVLDGGFRVKGLRRVSDPAVLARLPPEARGSVRVADLKAQGFAALEPQKSYGYGLNNKTVRELDQGGAPLPVARWPNAEALKIGEVIAAPNRVFACKSERLARWSEAS
jgi:hypothetical protein